jgi:hypothetical protein
MSPHSAVSFGPVDGEPVWSKNREPGLGYDQNLDRKGGTCEQLGMIVL